MTHGRPRGKVRDSVDSRTEGTALERGAFPAGQEQGQQRDGGRNHRGEEKTTSPPARLSADSGSGLPMERYQDVGGTTKKWGNIWSLCHHSAGSAWQESILVPGSGCVCVWVCVCVCVCVRQILKGRLHVRQTPRHGPAVQPGRLYPIPCNNGKESEDERVCRYNCVTSLGT